MKRRLPSSAHQMLGDGKLELHDAADEYGNWLFDPDLVQLRAEWITAFNEWNQIEKAGVDAVLTDQLGAKLHRYHEAETAYFSRCRERSHGTG